MPSFAWLAFLLAGTVVVDATQVMHKPSTFRDAPRSANTTRDPIVHHVHRRSATGKTQMAYFTNWGIYGANFQPTDIVPGPLTTILYSFADVSPETGVIALTDSYADEQKMFPGDSWNEPGTNLYGCLKQLYLLKLKQRNLKLVLSVGGWTYSQSGHFAFVTDVKKRAAFVSSAVTIVENYGFDGIDFDFEYPSSTTQGQGFANLITELRTAFTALQARKGDSTPYSISAAVAASAENYAYIAVPQMDAALTHWNLMAYDYAGSWSTFTDNQANLYGPSISGYASDEAIKWYISQGATAAKINLGIPLYGRAFEKTQGIGHSYNGIGPGTIEAGIYSYKVLPFVGATIYENATSGASYSYDPSTQELVSYDTPNIVRQKAQYVVDKGLSGSMFWELSTDKVGADSLVRTSADAYGALDQTENHINFPDSKFNNLATNFGLTPASTTMTRPSPTLSSTTTRTTSSAPTRAPASSKRKPSSSSPPTRASRSQKSQSTKTPASATTLPPPPSSARSTTTTTITMTATTTTSCTTTSAPASSGSKTATASSRLPRATPTGPCIGVAPWSMTAIYWGGYSATFQGHAWTAKWWTQGDVPGGDANVWTQRAAC